MNIAANISYFRSLMPQGVELVAVSKFHPVSALREAYDAGQRLFGESRVQELLEKIPVLPEDIRWHFIGHLQTNKVKQIIGKTALIESIDSERLLNLIDRESDKSGVITEVLLQVHVAAEEAKFGFYPQELRDFFFSEAYKSLKAVRIRGLMGMATNTDDESRVVADFALLHSLFLEIKETLHRQSAVNPGVTQDSDKIVKDTFENDFNKLSMGMSGDWQLAVTQGANIVRIGSAIFGSRGY